MNDTVNSKVRIQLSGTLLFKKADGSVKEVPFEAKSDPMDPENAAAVLADTQSLEIKQ